MHNDEKIPSVISYSLPNNAQTLQWGKSLSPGSVAMVHTKLELDVHDTSEELDLILGALDGMKNLRFQCIRDAGPLPSYTWKGPEEIVEDYLTRVFETVLKGVEDEEEYFPEELRARIPVDIVVTVPAVCHCIALYVKAAKFFMSRTGPSGLKTLHFEHLLEPDSIDALSQSWQICCWSQSLRRLQFTRLDI
jgi:hypothetical protein